MRISLLAGVLLVVLAVCVASTGLPVNVWAEPNESSPGEEGPDGGVQFRTQFIISITGLLIDEVTDCLTGATIPAGQLQAEFVFKEGAEKPYKLEDLEKIILTAEGYQSKEITSFTTIRLMVGLVQLTFIVPHVRSLCLSPTGIVVWNERSKLTWDDFKGEVNQSSERNAETYTGISMNWECTPKREFKFHIRAHVDQTRSWVKPDKKTDKLLEHEQGHFDITELFARKLREELKKIKCDQDLEKSEQQINQIYNRIVREENAEQEKYDTETNHGTNEAKQREWNQKIKSQLRSTQGQ
jgi:hypothetical protein